MLLTASIASALTILAAIGTVIWGSKAGQVGVKPPRTVPDVAGQSVAEADRTLTHADLNCIAQGDMQGHASSQTPTAGSEAFYGDFVTVTFA